jgi:hypothetical protein
MKISATILFSATLSAGLVNGQILFQDNFDSLGGSPVTATAGGTFAGYSVSMSSTDNRVIFGYDYSLASLGIPSAPHSSGGSQIGARFDANLNLSVISSLVITPATTTFPGDFKINFDMWMNSVGAFPAGGTGSSENMTVGVGYNGTTFQNNSSGSGVWFSGTGDGGFSGTSTTPDYEARINATLQGPTSGVYAAGTATGASGSSVDNANVYYTSRFPGVPAPAAQGQTGTPANGSLLFAWHSVEVDRSGNTVTWWIDNNIIATVTDANATATDKISIGYWDPAASKDAGNVYGIIDNLVVAAPEPGTGALALLGGLSWFMARRRK